MTNAAAVARALKKAGITTVPRHGRDGLFVAGTGRVTLGVNHVEAAPPAWAKRLVADATEVLTEAGFTVEPNRADEEGLLHVVTRDG